MGTRFLIRFSSLGSTEFKSITTCDIKFRRNARFVGRGCTMSTMRSSSTYLRCGDLRITTLARNRTCSPHSSVRITIEKQSSCRPLQHFSLQGHGISLHCHSSRERPSFTGTPFSLDTVSDFSFIGGTMQYRVVHVNAGTYCSIFHECNLDTCNQRSFQFTFHYKPFQLLYCISLRQLNRLWQFG